ncbi:MAG: molybdopterin dinucleotide binding domain-containing protein [Candidatus Bathyarchaeia archaeon]
MVSLKVTLITGRTLGQGQSMEYAGKFSREYKEKVATCSLDLYDFMYLGVAEEECVRVTTSHGSVVLKVLKSKEGPHSGIAFVPYGPWASVLMGSDTKGTGMPTLKGVPAVIEPATGEKVPELEDLLRKITKE